VSPKRLPGLCRPAGRCVHQGFNSRGCNAKSDLGPDGFGGTKRQTATKRSSTGCSRAIIFSSRSRGPPTDRTGVPVEHGAELQGDGAPVFLQPERGRPAGQSSFRYRIKFQNGALRCWRRIMLNLWNAYIRTTQVGWDANVVVAMRLMRLPSA